MSLETQIKNLIHWKVVNHISDKITILEDKYDGLSLEVSVWCQTTYNPYLLSFDDFEIYNVGRNETCLSEEDFILSLKCENAIYYKVRYTGDVKLRHNILTELHRILKKQNSVYDFGSAQIYQQDYLILSLKRK